MKLERIHESVLPTVVITGGLALAILCGSLAGTGNLGKLAAVFGGVLAVVGLIVLRHRAWMLIPILWVLPAKIPILPLPFSLRQLGVLFAFVVFLIMKAVKISRLKPTRGLLDTWVVIVIAYLVTVFLRNPVGFEALGANRVGGKPYFEVIIGLAGYWVLCRSIASRRDALFLPLFVVASSIGDFMLNFIAVRFPSTAAPLGQLYSGITANDPGNVEGPASGDGDQRQGYMSGFASSTSLAAFSYWRPFSVINPLNPFRFIVLAAAAYAMLTAGFRSGIFSIAMAFLIGSYFRKGMIEVFRAGLVVAALLTVALSLQGRVISLPLPAQRALSFLPGKWEYGARSDAQGSTEWRVTMWRAMLTGDKYIANKWLGDGFGFTRRQLDIMNANMAHGTIADQQENLLISGGVHSGPIGAVRFVGIVGLILFIVFAVLVAVHAARLIRRCEKTPFYPLALFIGIPTVWFPFSYLFVFGSYGDDLPGLLITVGLLKMLENSLDADAEEQKVIAARTNQPERIRRPARFAPAMKVKT